MHLQGALPDLVGTLCLATTILQPALRGRGNPFVQALLRMIEVSLRGALWFALKNNDHYEWLQLKVSGGMPVPVHPNAPSRYNPIHEDDLIAMIPGLLAIASVTPAVVNCGTGDHRGVVRHPRELTPAQARRPPTRPWTVTVDLARLRELVGTTKVDLRDGLRRMVSARHPELIR